MVCTQDNPSGPITNSDLELAGLLICWLVMEDVAPSLYHKHVGLYRNNSAAVAWVDRMATRSLKVAGPLFMALAMCLRERRTSLLTPLHIAGVQNRIGDIPSRSFDGTLEWHYETDDEFLTLFNSTSPVPNQILWQIYRVPSSTYTGVITVLQHQGIAIDMWRRLTKTKTSTAKPGSSIANLWELTLHWRQKPLPTDKNRHNHVLLGSSQVRVVWLWPSSCKWDSHFGAHGHWRGVFC